MDTKGNKRIAVLLIGAAVLGAPALGLVMSVQGRPTENFILLWLCALASLVLGVFLLKRG
jgi:hypothetical protein